MKTLLHELCHNVVGPHNAVFLLFMRMSERSTSPSPARPRAGTRTLADASTKETAARELASEAGNGALQGGERASAAFVANAVSACYPTRRSWRRRRRLPSTPLNNASHQRRRGRAPPPRRQAVCSGCVCSCAIRARRDGAGRPARVGHGGGARSGAVRARAASAIADPGPRAAAAMGFEGTAAAAALKATAGDVSAALERLLNPGAAVSAIGNRVAPGARPACVERPPRARCARTRRCRDVDHHPHERERTRTSSSACASATRSSSNGGKVRGGPAAARGRRLRARAPRPRATSTRSKARIQGCCGSGGRRSPTSSRPD